MAGPCGCPDTMSVGLATICPKFVCTEQPKLLGNEFVKSVPDAL